MPLKPPDDLATVLNQQIDRLVKAGAHEQLGLGEDAYRAELEEVVEAFSWRTDWAEIGLHEVVLVDPRLSDQFLADKAGITCYVSPDDCSNYEGIVTPTMPYVIQMQSGSKYRKRNPVDVRNNFPPIERGIVLSEALCWALYQNYLVDRLRDCYMDIVGSVCPDGSVPYLYLFGDRPVLYACSDDSAYPYYGSGSAGSG